MPTLQKFIPAFRGSCLIAGCLNIFFFLTMVSQGIMQSMAEFNVPSILLNSPHYADAIFWVFLHMAMLGVLLILLGIAVENTAKQIWVARVLVLVFCIYCFLDIRTSDNPLGNALYQGPRSMFPVFVDVFYILMFLRLSFMRKE